MSNADNLKGKGFESRSTSELREMQSRGGKKSGETRRRKANFRKTLNLLLTTEIDNPIYTPILEALGIDSTLEAAVNMAMIKQALAGDVKAYEAIARYSGQTTRTEKDLEEQQIKIDRDKRARDQETGEDDGAEENIQSFLKALHPTREDLESIFAGGDEDGETSEETG